MGRLSRAAIHQHRRTKPQPPRAAGWLTGAADAFDANANSTVLSFAIPRMGRFCRRHFRQHRRTARNLFARLTNDTPAQQNLTVTSSTIIWTRSGASAQLTRVTFESSTDNVNYTPLGNGIAAGSSWTLSSLSLPTGQHVYIRARGYYRTGSNNASESIAESVRDAFITLPPMPTQVVSRKLHSGAPFDIPLPLTGNSGIECRSGGATNDYQVVFTFPARLRSRTPRSLQAREQSAALAAAARQPLLSTSPA